MDGYDGNKGGGSGDNRGESGCGCCNGDGDNESGGRGGDRDGGGCNNNGDNIGFGGESGGIGSDGCWWISVDNDGSDYHNLL